MPIFEWVKDVKPGTAMVVGARAGSGKTTTGVEMFKMLDPKLDSICVVFNRHVVAPMKAKAPSYVKVCTYNSLGYAACRAAFGNSLMLDEDKAEKILRTILDKMTNGGLYPTILKLVSLVKANLTGTSYDELQSLAEYYGVEINGDTDTVFAAVGLVV
ncbi:MAG: UvrD/REP helicase, partial [Microgenomates group bacterium GW2011_GWC1_39_7]